MQHFKVGILSTAEQKTGKTHISSYDLSKKYKMGEKFTFHHLIHCQANTFRNNIQRAFLTDKLLNENVLQKYVSLSPKILL